MIDPVESVYAQFDLDVPLPDSPTAVQQLKDDIKSEMITALNSGGNIVSAGELEIESLTSVSARRRQSKTKVAFRITKRSTNGPGQKNAWEVYQEFRRQALDPTSALYQGSVMSKIESGSVQANSVFDCTGKPITDQSQIVSGDFKKFEAGSCVDPTKTLAPLSSTDTRSPETTRYPTRVPEPPPPPTTFAPVEVGVTRSPDITRYPTTMAPLAGTDTRPPTVETPVPEETRQPTAVIETQAPQPAPTAETPPATTAPITRATPTPTPPPMDSGVGQLFPSVWLLLAVATLALSTGILN